MNAEPGRSDADQSTPISIQTRVASARALSQSDTPNLRAPLHGSNALSTIRIREALTFSSIKRHKDSDFGPGCTARVAMHQRGKVIVAPVTDDEPSIFPVPDDGRPRSALAEVQQTPISFLPLPGSSGAES